MYFYILHYIQWATIPYFINRLNTDIIFYNFTCSTEYTRSKLLHQLIMVISPNLSEIYEIPIPNRLEKWVRTYQFLNLPAWAIETVRNCRNAARIESTMTMRNGFAYRSWLLRTLSAEFWKTRPKLKITGKQTHQAVAQ